MAVSHPIVVEFLDMPQDKQEEQEVLVISRNLMNYIRRKAGNGFRTVIKYFDGTSTASGRDLSNSSQTSDKRLHEGAVHIDLRNLTHVDPACQYAVTGYAGGVRDLRALQTQLALLGDILSDSSSFDEFNDKEMIQTYEIDDDDDESECDPDTVIITLTPLGIHIAKNSNLTGSHCD